MRKDGWENEIDQNTGLQKNFLAQQDRNGFGNGNVGRWEYINNHWSKEKLQNAQ